MDSIERDFLNYFDIEKIDNETYAIKESKIFYRANCFLLIHEGEGILIDALTGVYSEFLKSLEHIFHIKIRKLYLTHAHYDHFGGFDGRIIKEVYLSKYETCYLSKYYLTNKYVRKEIYCDGKSEFPNGFEIEKYKVKHIKNVREFPKKIIIGNRILEVIETPGHSKGSTCFYETSRKYFYSGDFLYRGDVDIFEDPTSSYKDFILSLEKCKDLEINKFLCGHYDAQIDGNKLSIKELYKDLLKIDVSDKAKIVLRKYDIALLIRH